MAQGFRDELEEIISAAPRSRQTLLFSATVTESIQQLTRLSMNKPVRVKIDEMGAAAKGLDQECKQYLHSRCSQAPLADQSRSLQSSECAATRPASRSS